MRKKILIISLVVILGSLGLFAYNNYLKEEAVAGQKEVKVEIVIDREDINRSFEFSTEKEYLSELLKENKDKLDFSYKDSEYGTMVTGLMNYQAQESEKEFFHISVNGEEAKTGINEIVLNDGDVYRFELKKW